MNLLYTNVVFVAWKSGDVCCCCSVVFVAAAAAIPVPLCAYVLLLSPLFV